ncbi:hypothetical protein KAR34_03640 [bacterium]|nr:hypothetical protein [bacterium]
MRAIGAPEKSNTFRYALLSTKVSGFLKKAENGISLNDMEYQTLVRGNELLKQIIEGSILLERRKKTEDFSASQEGLSVYGYALSAVEKLQFVSSDNDITEIFINLYNEMALFLEKGKREQGILKKLRMFYSMLSKLFSKDIQQDMFNEPNEQKLSVKWHRYF